MNSASCNILNIGLCHNWDVLNVALNNKTDLQNTSICKTCDFEGIWAKLKIKMNRTKKKKGKEKKRKTRIKIKRLINQYAHWCTNNQTISCTSYRKALDFTYIKERQIFFMPPFWKFILDANLQIKQLHN